MLNAISSGFEKAGAKAEATASVLNRAAFRTFFQLWAVALDRLGDAQTQKHKASDKNGG